MDRDNRPHSREKNVSGSSSGVHRRGSGLGTGRVGLKDYSSKGARHGGFTKIALPVNFFQNAAARLMSAAEKFA